MPRRGFRASGIKCRRTLSSPWLLYPPQATESTKFICQARWGGLACRRMKLAGVNPRWYASALGLVYLFYWIFQILYTEWEDNLPLNQGPALHLYAARITNSVLA